MAQPPAFQPGETGGGMPEPQGRTLPLTEPRRFIGDLAHFARQVPSVPVARTMDLSALIGPRLEHPARPSWAVVFMKAYACVAAAHAPLRRCLLTVPTARLYEHPQSHCALALEREFNGEHGIFVGLFRAPDRQSLVELDQALRFYKHEPVESIGFFRQELRVCRAPLPIRRLLWWSTLNISGVKRAKRFGTFGLSSYGSLGAEQLHPISPLSTTLTYGPIDDEGRVCVKIIYDHRVLDGAYVARRLADLEHTLQSAIHDELRAGVSRRVAPAA